jgi:hypothetical protein
MRLAFADTAATIDVPDDPDFLGALSVAATGWPFATTESGGDPVAAVRKSGDRFEIGMEGEDPVLTSAVAAACSVMVDMVGAYLAEHPRKLCFHGAAALFAGRLVVFPSRAHAGKSTLMARLAQAGHTIFSDDMLPLSEDDLGGVGLGIAPRLRLPLPEAARPELRRFVSRHAAASDGRYLYLKLPSGRLAPRESVAPLGAVVLLDRRGDCPAELARASRAAILESLIVQNFARSAHAGELLDRLHRIMARLPRLILHYHDLEEATALLEQTFSAWPPSLNRLAEADMPALEPREGEQAQATPGAVYPPGTPLLRNDAIRLHDVDGELFLADAEGASIHRLNMIGAGLWRLLAEPISQEAAVDILCGAFPETPRERIADDVARVFAGLAAGRFIAPANSLPEGE